MSDQDPPFAPAPEPASGAERYPTLTEVVELGPGHAPPAVVPLLVDVALPGAGELVALVLAELQPRIDLLFEARLREAVAPALARAADALVRDTRDELAATLRALVDEAVQQALRRERGP
ncbi:MAG: hypothetical protein KGL18_00010 [Burkholderiales bacterium]|nr:hypothetical protein [Burkholderiales bacterium]MDE1928809.1 hypothetical protein [Burkholderiales bacterium]MDE2501344.1 hypothetical protein [Burkholderiales bacterium]